MLFRPGFPIGGGIGGLTFIYAVPVMLLGAALLYAELLPVEAGSQDQEMEDFGDWYVSDVWAMRWCSNCCFFYCFLGRESGGGGLIPKDPPKIPQRSPKDPTGFPVSTGRNRSRRRALSHSESQRTADRRRIAVCVTEAVGLFDTKATSTMQKAPGPPTIEPNSCRRTPGEGRCHPSSLWWARPSDWLIWDLWDVEFHWNKMYIYCIYWTAAKRLCARVCFLISNWPFISYYCVRVWDIIDHHCLL